MQPLCRTVWRFLKKLEIELPYDPTIPLLGIHTEETRIERDKCTPMFIAALFIIARTWKQPGSFQVSQFFPSGSQSIGVSASTSVLPMNTQDRSPLGWTDWINVFALEDSFGEPKSFRNISGSNRVKFCV